jgi:transposase
VPGAREVQDSRKANRVRNKTDREDAELLARTARLHPKLLQPIEHRSVGAQASLAALSARPVVVAARMRLILHVRGGVKSFGVKIPICAAFGFHRKAEEEIPSVLKRALLPLVESIGKLLTDAGRRHAGRHYGAQG